jgi:Protein of unknown function (DUF3570)
MQLIRTARAQWTFGLALAAATTTALPAADARAEGNVSVRGASEVAAYQDSTATTVFTPTIAGMVENPTAGWGMNGRYVVDVVSAASPDIISTASRRWVEVRNAGNLGFKYKPKLFGVNAGVSTSYTPDYLSLGASVGVVQELDEKNLTLSGGYSYGRDTIGRTGTSFSDFSRLLQYHSFNAGLSRVLSRSTVLSFSGDFTVERGDQSKPYRYIPLFRPDRAAVIGGGATADFVQLNRVAERPLEQLPLARERYAITTRLATRGQSGTLRLDERLYYDSWGLKASTTDFRYMADLSDRVIVWPHLRFHGQTAVDFWKIAYVSKGPLDIPALRTGDRELGAMLNAQAGVGTRLALGPAGAKDSFLLTASVDAVLTHWFNALYIENRLSMLGVVTLDKEF